MKLGMGLLALVVSGLLVYLYSSHMLDPLPGNVIVAAAEQEDSSAVESEARQPEAGAIRGVFDISVHSIEELEVLFDRAEELASRPRPVGGNDNVVLVLHGPEVEFFAISNYEKYRSIVDRAARLDAFHVVDVKICQTMMQNYGLAAEDIPAFIEQVPNGAVEVERLSREGYTYF